MGIQAGLALMIGWLWLFGWLLIHVVGPLVDKDKAQLKRDQAGAERYGWQRGVDTDAMLGSAAAASLRHSGRLRRMLVGQHEGRPIRMAEYTYSSGGKLPTKVVNHVVAVELPVLLPDLVVGERGQFELPLARFESESEAFNRAFDVYSADQRYSSAVLHPRMMEFLLANPGLRFRIFGPLIVIAAPAPWTVPGTLAVLPVLHGIAERIPPFVLQDFGRPRVSG
ncbi:DUF3137 domain-containing protein [Kribbella sandramycini]|nr:DUF3137 domain-containing protein [Kribbella sandramycini]NOL40356.1 DUF3137 domain-containing protein [Kribbella sandramycini]